MYDPPANLKTRLERTYDLLASQPNGQTSTHYSQQVSYMYKFMTHLGTMRSQNPPGTLSRQNSRTQLNGT
jgi:hypothetical protein